MLPLITGAPLPHGPLGYREFYERLRRRGKPGKVAVVACMRKLALISWAYYKMAMHT